MNTSVRRPRRKLAAARGKRRGAAASSSSPEIMDRDSTSDVSATDISAADTGKAEESKSETSLKDMKEEYHKGTAWRLGSCEKCDPYCLRQIKMKQ